MGLMLKLLSKKVEYNQQKNSFTKAYSYAKSPTLHSPA